MSIHRALVDPATLAAHLGDPHWRLLDARFSLTAPEACAAAWREACIPGAAYAHLDHDLSDHRKRGHGRHPWPDDADFAERVAAWGIGPDTQVVVYDAGDAAMAAARAWCMLHLAGHAAVAVLDGGLARWQAEGMPMEQGAPHAATAAGDTSHLRFDGARLFDAGRVRRHLEQGGLLLDARSAERFAGVVEPLDPVAGHIPGAVNRPYQDNLRDGRFKPAEELRAEFAALLQGRPPHALVAMCGSGVTACHHLLALEAAGLHGVGLYADSWSGWIADPANPVATGP